MLSALFLLLLMQQAANVPSQNGVVEGVLRTSSGSPAPGVRVSAMVPPALDGDAAGAAALASLAETDGQGRYRLEGVPPGRYYIVAGRVDLPTYYPGTAVIKEGAIVTVPSGGTVSGVNFALNDRSVGRANSGLTLLSGGPAGLSLSVSIQVEGGGKVPVFGNGHYPVLRLIKVGATQPFEMWFSASTITVPIPAGTAADEYKVAVADLPDGYAVKAVTYGSADVLKETLKVSNQSLGIQPAGVAILGLANSGIPLSITLAHTPPPAASGFRVTGRSAGAGDDVYLSGKPGILYVDGTFEFHGVPPGFHTILKYRGNMGTAARVLVKDRDIDGVRLQSVSILPIDAYSSDAKVPDGNVPVSSDFYSIVGRVLDGTSLEPLEEGTVTVTGYGSVRRDYANVAGQGFRISPLLPGAYTITINVFGYNGTVHPVVVGLEDLKVEVKATRNPSESLLRQQ